jgi:hypothetical protein
MPLINFVHDNSFNKSIALNKLIPLTHPSCFETHLSKIREGKKAAICANTYFPLFMPDFSGNNRD